MKRSYYSKYVSVVMPTYNRADRIEHSIRSVLNQTIETIELIIVDDCSTDNTETVIRRIGDERIRYIRLMQNQGQSVARNRGIEEAKYDVVAFADSDDVWFEDKLERQLSVLSEECKAVYCAFSITDAYLRTTFIPDKSISRDLLHGDMMGLLRKRNVIGTPALIVEKKLLEAIGGFDERLHALEDWDLALRLARRTQMGFVNDCLLRAGSNLSGVNKNSRALLDARLIMLGKTNEYHLEQDEIAYWFVKDIYRTGDMDLYYERLWNALNEPEQCAKKLIRRMGTDAHKERRQYDIIRRISDTSIMHNFLQHIIQGDDSVSVYGMGWVGVVLVDKLKEMRVPLSSILDQSVVEYRGHPVISLEEAVFDRSEKVIITPFDHYETISRSLEKKCTCECVSIEQINSFVTE